MKRKSFLLPVAALALLVSFGLAACGGNGGEGGKESGQQQTSGKQEKITITAAENKTKLILGESVQLTASVDGVTWSSADDTIATVSATGLVESKAVGRVAIKANKDGYKEGSITIAIDLEKIEVTATGDKTSLLAGETVQLVSSQQGVTWESDAPEIATVSDTGLVTAIKFGSANIKAKKQGFNDGSITINVVRPDPNLVIDLTTGAEHYSADGWWAITSSSYGFAMESGGGATPVTQTQSYGQETESDTYIGAFGIGDKETVKFNSSKATKAEVVINIGNSDEVSLGLVMAIKLNGTALDLSQVTLAAHEGQSGNSLEFGDLSLGELDIAAENTLVFEMLADNTVYLNEIAIYAGDTTVTLVNPPEKQQIAINPASYEVIVDETVQIVTTETGVSFTSLDETIATVNDTGLVTGVKVGKVNILLRKEGMYSVRAEVTVNPKPVAGQIIIEAEDAPEVTTDWGGGGYMKQTDGTGMGGSAVHSGGAYVTYFSMGGGDVDLTLTLEFTASEAKTMVLSIVGSAPVNFMGGDSSAYVFADSAEITVNDNALTFTDQEFPAPESGSFTVEMTEVVLGDVAVQSGPNTLVFHTTGAAPSIDCFKLSVKA